MGGSNDALHTSRSRSSLQSPTSSTSSPTNSGVSLGGVPYTDRGRIHSWTSGLEPSYQGRHVNVTTASSISRGGLPTTSSDSPANRGGVTSTSFQYEGDDAGQQTTAYRFGSRWPDQPSPFSVLTPLYPLSDPHRPIAFNLTSETKPEAQVSSQLTYSDPHQGGDGTAQGTSRAGFGYTIPNTGDESTTAIENQMISTLLPQTSDLPPPSVYPPRAMSTISETSSLDSGYYSKTDGVDEVRTAVNKMALTTDTARLAPGYNLKNGYLFFEPGRVFSTMLPEPMGVRPGGIRDSPSNANVVEGLSGEKIYYHIRRFIVIKRRRGYSLCVPINTYLFRGVQSKLEQEAHSIVYDSSTKQAPSKSNGENRMTKTPIAVDLNQGHKLNPASRIHFGRITSIDWNSKVLDIGHVAQSSMPVFEKYWKEELLQ
ncbi:hypothetical protein LTR84_002986 [Exophiala bonariae]|uniref:DUF6590 domain-containing protein n=1 Tax=Exophiala bonariae TaxID=1690606 RepID=A0AAV9NB94_9EURO|nr:hypothetical protein LTR84_002986 [Exophiala bonariae]